MLSDAGRLGITPPPQNKHFLLKLHKTTDGQKDTSE